MTIHSQTSVRPQQWQQPTDIRFFFPRRYVLPIAFVTCIAFLAFTQSSLAGTHYVSKTGSNTYPYDSWATATDSVKLAIETASNWDTVKVGPGLYIEDSIQLKKGMLLSGAGSDSTTLEISKYDGILTQFVLMGDSSILEGFLIQGKNNQDDKGVVLRPAWGSHVRNNMIRTFNSGLWADLGTSSSAEISHNTFALCERSIYILGGFPQIRSNRIYPSYASEAIYCLVGAPIVEGNVIGGAPSGLTRAEREAFYGVAEPARYGWSIWVDAPHTFVVRNNVMWGQATGVYVDNNSNYDGGLPWGLVQNNTCVDFASRAIYVTRNNVLVVSNLIADVGPLAHPAVEGTLYNIRFEYNLIWNYDNPPVWGPGNAPVGNVFADPMFVDSLDFHLQAFSPAIDAGDSTVLDKDGTRSDIGAYGGPSGESYQYFDLPPDPPAPFSGVRSDTLIGLAWGANTEADICCYQVYRDTASFSDVTFAKLLESVPAPDTTYADTQVATGESYYYRVSAIDLQANRSVASGLLNLVATRVDGDQEGVRPYEFALPPNYPNPFNSSTIIRLVAGGAAHSGGHVFLSVHDVLGRRVRVLFSGTMPVGEHKVLWDGLDENGRPVASGVYIVRAVSEGGEKYRKVLLLR